MSQGDATPAPQGTDHPFWDVEEPKEIGDSLDDWMRRKVLQKGEDYKLDPRVEAVKMGLSWDRGFDIDASAAMLDGKGDYIDVACFRQLRTKCGSLVHSGDDVTGEEEGDDELISVYLDKVPTQVHHILFIVSMLNPSISFEKVHRASVRMLCGKDGTKGDELCDFALTQMKGNAVLMGHLTRKKAHWYFRALGEAIPGSSVRDVLQNPEYKQYLQQYPSEAPQYRKVTVKVLKGRNLAAKDMGVLGLKKASSDPYYIITFKDSLYKSEYKSRNLEPVWEQQPFDMGWLVETDMRLLEIVIFDHDVLRTDDFMGRISISAKDLYKRGMGSHTCWIKLRKSPDKKYEREVVSGEILFNFKIEEAPVAASQDSTAPASPDVTAPAAPDVS